MSYHGIDAKFVAIDVWPTEPTRRREISRFKTTVGKTVDLLKRELRHLGAKNLIIQLDMDASQIRLDGYPRADARSKGPGVIVTFDSKHGPLSYPCDRFTRWDDNLRAIALALEALRTVDRYGVTRRGEQYRGWGKLPPAGGTTVTMDVHEAAALFVKMGGGNALQVLNSRELAGEVYRRAVKAAHPDSGGSTQDFQQLQEARRALDRHHGGARP